MNRVRWYGPTFVLLITMLVVLIGGPIAARNIVVAQHDAEIKLAANDLQHNKALTSVSQAFRKVAKVVEPSVVSVKVLSRSKPPQQRNGNLLRRFFGPNWKQFFGPNGPNPNGQGGPNGPQPFGPSPQGPGTQQNPQGGQNFQKYNPAHPIASGSGWVYDTKGHIVTNNHVVENADALQVAFSDGSHYDATVVGRDPSTDVAVIKIDANDLHKAQLATGKDQQVEPGEIVFAFGSPFGFKFSVSQGIVSATGRQLHIIQHGQGYENFIQTDAAINPGNSGGPLTNVHGQVVGMNAAIATRTGASNGLGFAIPIRMVKDVVDQIIKKGKVTRGYLGVYIRDLTPKMAKTFNYQGEGVLVLGPSTPGSPAAKAGLKRGDIITSINDNKVSSAEDLRYLIAGLQPGTRVNVQVFRNGGTKNFKVTLGELPSQKQLAQGGGQGGGGAAGGGNAHGQSGAMQTLEKFGIQQVQPFTQQLAQQLGVSFEPGVVVRSVRQGSSAADAGITPGTVITDVQGQTIKNVQQLLKQVKSHNVQSGVRLGVKVWDRGNHRYLPGFVVLSVPNQQSQQ